MARSLNSSNNSQTIDYLGLALNDTSNNEENIEYLQLPINDLNGNLQYHLKAENGKISYKIINIQSTTDKPNSYVINNSNTPIILTPDQSTQTAIKMNSSTTVKRRITANQAAQKIKDQKRSKHNEIERKRRDNINNWIMKLSKIVPDCQADSAKQAQPKGVILSKACDYITKLTKDNTKLYDVLDENNSLRDELNDCKKELDEMETEIDYLKDLLKENGISVKKSSK